MKDIVEKEAEETAKEQKKDDVEQYDTVAEIKLVYESRCVKEFRVIGNLNGPNTRMIMDNITPHIELRIKLIYSFKADIHQGAGEIVDYSKTLTSPPGMFTSLKETQAYIKVSEQRRLDLENEEVWSKAYLRATRTTEARSNYEGRVIFTHGQIRLVASNKPLMGSGPLPDWLRKKGCIYAIETFDDNLYVWRCLTTCKHKDVKRGSEFVIKEALDLACEC